MNNLLIFSRRNSLQRPAEKNTVKVYQPQQVLLEPVRNGRTFE